MALDNLQWILAWTWNAFDTLSGGEPGVRFDGPGQAAALHNVVFLTKAGHGLGRVDHRILHHRSIASAKAALALSVHLARERW